MNKIYSRRTLRYFSIAGLVMIFAVFAGCSHWRNQPIEKKVTKVVDRAAKKLELSPDQKIELNQIKEEMLKQYLAEENVKKRSEIRRAFVEMFKGDSLDKEKLIALHAKKQEERKEMEDLLTNKFIQFHKMLTPAQRAKFADWVEKFAVRMEK
jgi:Spy/CpxP family protein refolding chaperone